MSDQTRTAMMATLAEIEGKPSTPGRERAKGNIRAALSRMSSHAARAPRGGPPVRAITTYDRERLMKIAEDGQRGEGERGRAREILDGDGSLREGCVEFLRRAD